MLLDSRDFPGIEYDIGLKIEDTLQISKGNVQEMTNPAGQAFEKPDMRARTGQLNVTQPLSPHLGLNDLNAALVANDAAMLHSLVLPAQAFPVRNRAENSGAEQTFLFRFKCPVIDSLRLGNFTM